MKATASVILYKSKTLANDEHPIMLRICYNGKRVYKSLKMSCSPKLWNEERGEVRSKHPYSVNMNSIIINELSKLKNLVLTMRDVENHILPKFWQMKSLSLYLPQKLYWN